MSYSHTVSKLPFVHTNRAYLESLLNIENRPDARFLLILVFSNEDALDARECAAENVEVFE